MLLLSLLAHATPPTIHIDRQGRVLYLIDTEGRITRTEAVGVGRGGLSVKASMADLITPTGDFVVDLILTATSGEVDVTTALQFSVEPGYAALLADASGLSSLFANMNGIDFDGDGVPDGAYGSAYIGLASEEAVTGPKMRYYRDGTPYWFSIALHGTPTLTNIGAANSGGCVHLSADLLGDLIGTGMVRIGSPVVIRDGPPAAR